MIIILKRNTRYYFNLIIYLFISISFLIAQPISIQKVGETLNGEAKKVVANEDIVIVLAGSSLLIFSHDLQLITEFRAGYILHDIFLVENNAIITMDEGGLGVIDITDPINPILISNLSLPQKAEAVIVQGDTAYVASTRGGLHLVDITNYQNLVYLGGNTEVNHWSTHDIAVKENIVYLSSSYAKVNIYDISQNDYPMIGTVGTSPGYSLDIRDSILFIGSYGLKWYDISDPSSPNFINQAGNSYTFNFSIYDTLVYFSELQSWLPENKIYDISDINNPEFVGSFHGESWGNDVKYLFGSTLFDIGYGTVCTYNISNPLDPILNHNVNPGGSVNEISAFDSVDIVAVAAGFGGIRFVDLTVPSNPIEISNQNAVNPWDIYSLHVMDVAINSSGSYCVYSIDNSEPNYGGVGLISINDPANPSHQDLYLSGYNGWNSVNINGNYIYGTGSFYDWDTHEWISGLFTFYYDYSGISYQGNFEIGIMDMLNFKDTLITTGNPALSILEVSNGQPIQIGFLNHPNYARAFAVEQNLSCLWSNDSIFVADISNPEEPMLLSSYYFPFELYFHVRIALYNNYFFISHFNDLFLFRFNENQQIELISQIMDSGQYIRDIEVWNDYLLLTRSNVGLQVYQIYDTAIQGDVNLDGITNVNDLELLVDYILGLIDLSQTQLNMGDIDSDELITIFDVLLLADLLY